MSEFETTIKTYLDSKATEDSVFASKYANEKKSIEKCCKYITEEVRKKATNGVAIIEDKQVYGLAIHYYDEQDLEIDKDKPKAITTTPQVVISKATPSKAEQNKAKQSKNATEQLLFNF